MKEFRTEKLSTHKNQGKSISWLVRVGEEIVGRVDKHRNTRHDVYPWRVFRKIGEHGIPRFRLIAVVFNKRSKLPPLQDELQVVMGNRTRAIQIAAFGIGGS